MTAPDKPNPESPALLATPELGEQKKDSGLPGDAIGPQPVQGPMELLPCPFDGGRAEYLTSYYKAGPSYWMPKGHSAACKECKASSPEFKTRNEAADWWNRRVVPSDPARVCSPVVGASEESPYDNEEFDESSSSPAAQSESVEANTHVLQMALREMHGLVETAVHAFKGKLPNPDLLDRDETGEALAADLTGKADKLLSENAPESDTLAMNSNKRIRILVYPEPQEL